MRTSGKSVVKIQINSLEALTNLVGDGEDVRLEIKNKTASALAETFIKDAVQPELQRLVAQSRAEIQSFISNNLFEFLGVTIKKGGYLSDVTFSEKGKRDLEKFFEQQLSQLYFKLLSENKEKIEKIIKDSNEVINNKINAYLSNQKKYIDTEMNKIIDEKMNARFKALKEAL